jgi:DNA polymerase-3 subunit alpha
VLVPDVNVSASDFTAVVESDGSGTIPFGLSAVRNVGEGLVELIVQERDADGPFEDFYDFCNRVDPTVLNKRTIESLIKAGGFDSMGHPRGALLPVFERIIDRTVERRREEAMGVMSLFGEVTAEQSGFDDLPKIEGNELDKKVRLAFEKEMLGLYVSDHPLMGSEAALRRRTDGTIGELADAEDGKMTNVGGVVTALQKKWTKRGDLMAVFTLEDLSSSMEVMVFPRTMTDHGHKLVDDGIVVVRGRVDLRDETPKIIAMEIEPFEPVDDGAPLVVKFPTAKASSSLVERLKGVLVEHPGDKQVHLRVGEQLVRLPGGFNVDTSNGLVSELRVLLGPDAVVG